MSADEKVASLWRNVEEEGSGERRCRYIYSMLYIAGQMGGFADGPAVCVMREGYITTTSTTTGGDIRYCACETLAVPSYP
jgi:hypothetical protein